MFCVLFKFITVRVLHQGNFTWKMNTREWREFMGHVLTLVVMVTGSVMRGG